jgi:hypothetical protein
MESYGMHIVGRSSTLCMWAARLWLLASYGCSSFTAMGFICSALLLPAMGVICSALFLPAEGLICSSLQVLLP